MASLIRGGRRGAALLAMATIAGLGVAACGSSSPPTARQPPTLRIAGAACQAKRRTKHGGYCTVLLSDATRYRCERSHSIGLTPANLPSNPHCTRIRALQVKASWTPVLGKLANARLCLRRHGLKVIGGAAVGGHPTATGAAGVVIVPTRHGGVQVGFYWTAAGATVAVKRFKDHKRLPGMIKQQGPVTVRYYFPKLLPKAKLAKVEACAFA